MMNKWNIQESVLVLFAVLLHGQIMVANAGASFDLDDSMDRSVMMELSRIGVIMGTYTYYGTSASDDKGKQLFTDNNSFATSTTGRNTAVIGRKLMNDGIEYCIMGFNGANSKAEKTDYRQRGKSSSGYQEYHHGLMINGETREQLDNAEDDIIDLLSGCYDGCTDKETCELVLVGHSAGGAKAVAVPNMIAAFATSEGFPPRWYEEPTIITFGHMRVIKKNNKGNSVVQDLDDRVFNFIRAMQWYDYVPYLWTDVTDTVGRPIMFPGGATKSNAIQNMRWYPNGDSIHRGGLQTLFGSYHDNSKFYYDPLKNLNAMDVSLDGYIRGVRCSVDSLCDADKCSFFGYCKK